MKHIKKGILGLVIIGMLLGLCACGEKGTIKIASKPMTEQYILTEILAQLIEAETDYKVEITKGVGGGISILRWWRVNLIYIRNIRGRLG